MILILFIVQSLGNKYFMFFNVLSMHVIFNQYLEGTQ